MSNSNALPPKSDVDILYLMWITGSHKLLEMQQVVEVG